MIKIIPASLKVYVFDMDDTLYDESLFVQGGTKRVLKWLSENYAIEFQLLDTQMNSVVTEFPRNEWYQRLLDKTGIPYSKELINTLIEIYRNHAPCLHLHPDSASFLTKIRKEEGAFLGLITDGMVSVQKVKAKCLGLDDMMDLSIFTWEKGEKFQKPHPWSFKYIEEKTGATGTECCYFGNDVTKDFLAPNKLGWHTVCICRNGGKRAAAPDRTYMAQDDINSFDEISLD